MTDYCIALHYGSPTVIITAQSALYSMTVPHLGSPVGQVQFRQMEGDRATAVYNLCQRGIKVEYTVGAGGGWRSQYLMPVLHT